MCVLECSKSTICRMRQLTYLAGYIDKRPKTPPQPLNPSIPQPFSLSTSRHPKPSHPPPGPVHPTTQMPSTRLCDAASNMTTESAPELLQTTSSSDDATTTAQGPTTTGENIGRPRTATTTAEIDSTIIHPGSVKINVKGAFIVEQEPKSPGTHGLNGRSGSPDHYQTKDIRLPNHTAVVSHIAVDVSQRSAMRSPLPLTPKAALHSPSLRRTVAGRPETRDLRGCLRADPHTPLNCAGNPEMCTNADRLMCVT